MGKSLALRRAKLRFPTINRDLDETSSCRGATLGGKRPVGMG